MGIIVSLSRIRFTLENFGLLWGMLSFVLLLSVHAALAVAVFDAETERRRERRVYQGLNLGGQITALEDSTM